ncbi:Smr/MutS family protein [Anianabacter salinae]|uniref:Smr/MutS family protein n=1 Tax=Anianabacter salinae TaxID=2851023 RepID=UPI00225E3616|nr:Smr/MutS family protein [Anianabacter salinae]MBV0913504.1 Smr/MutS family protein [Anianabacter salinae]
MTRKRPRVLTEEEQELWRRVQQATDPLHPKRTRQTGAAKAQGPETAPRKQPPALEPFEIGARKGETTIPHDLAATVSDDLGQRPVRMDRKRFDRMKRGKLMPEARLDLHGMTLDRAHPALMHFILGSQARGLRLVLVITGKGKPRDEGGPIPTRLGVLRHQVPQWLRLAPMAQAVLQVTEAHLRHGGGGAFYVYLRRNR